MKRQVRIRPRADRDLDDAADYYAKEGGIELAVRFLSAVERTWTMLADRPHSGVTQEWLASRLRGCRRWQVASPFGAFQVFYCPSDDAIDVVRVLHGARDVLAAFEEPLA